MTSALRNGIVPGFFLLFSAGVSAEEKNYLLQHPQGFHEHEPALCQIQPGFRNQKCPDVQNSDILLFGEADPSDRFVKVVVRHGYEGGTRKKIETIILPVESGRFEIDLYLRSGEGPYEASLAYSDQADASSSDGNWTDWHVIGFSNLDRSLNVHLLPSVEVTSEDPAIVALAMALTEGQTTQIEKARAIHDYVATHVAYDVESYQVEELWGRVPFNALHTLEQKKALCRGYSTLMAAMLRAIRIPTRIIEGEGRRVGRGFLKRLFTSLSWPVPNHSWVEAFIEGRWIAIDATWDAGRLNRDRSEFEFSLSHEYFDFKNGHRPVRVAPY